MLSNQNNIFIGVGAATIIGVLIWKLTSNISATPFSKSCSNLQGSSSVKDCVANGVESFLSNSLGKPGDCSTIKVNVGLLNTTISGQGC